MNFRLFLSRGRLNSVAETGVRACGHQPLGLDDEFAILSIEAYGSVWLVGVSVFAGESVKLRGCDSRGLLWWSSEGRRHQTEANRGKQRKAQSSKSNSTANQNCDLLRVESVGVAVMAVQRLVDISSMGTTQPSSSSHPWCSNWMVAWLIWKWSRST